MKGLNGAAELKLLVLILKKILSFFPAKLNFIRGRSFRAFVQSKVL